MQCSIDAVLSNRTGVVLQAASHGLGLLVAGRFVAGLGVGFVSAVSLSLFERNLDFY